jgi:3-keto-5-aminohexanoate cleavage enzyme
MDKAMEKVKGKYGDIPLTYVQMFGDLFCDLRVHPQWSVPELAVVSSAVCGAFITKAQNPSHPISTAEIRKEAIDSIEAGATSVHLHVRDEKTGLSVGDLKAYHEIVDPVKKKYGNKIVVDGCCVFGKTFEEIVAPITDGLFEVSPVNPVAGYIGDTVRYVPIKLMQASTEYFQEKGVKVQVSIHDSGSVDNAKRFLVNTGILKKPYYWIILPALPGILHMPSAKAMIESMMLIVNRLMEIDDNCIIMVCNAGRPAIYLTVLALLMGLHVRVGMEDTIWRYPHKEDRMNSNGQSVKEACDIAKLLGRRVATADEYRNLMGIKKK